jgi:spore coat polysaccharide biosynthesis predicted glycosyltransferase SpsG
LNYEIIFLTKSFPEIISLLNEYKFEVIELNQEEKGIKESIKEMETLLSSYNSNFSLIMVDLFKCFNNQDYLDCLKKYGNKLFVLSDDPHPFYIDVDGVFAVSPNQEPLDYTNIRTKYYTGLKYFPLQRDFETVPKKIIKKEISNILLTFGGSDPKNYSYRLIKILNDIQLNEKITLILGAAFSESNYNMLIHDQSENLIIKKNVKNMIDYLCNADLCICSAGNTLIEAIRCGVPIIALPQTETENERALALEKRNLILKLKLNFSDKDLISIIEDLWNNYSKRKRLSENAQRHLDGQGIKRIIKIITKNDDYIG